MIEHLWHQCHQVSHDIWHKNIHQCPQPCKGLKAIYRHSLYWIRNINWQNEATWWPKWNKISLKVSFLLAESWRLPWRQQIQTHTGMHMFLGWFDPCRACVMYRSFGQTLTITAWRDTRMRFNTLFFGPITILTFFLINSVRQIRMYSSKIKQNQTSFSVTCVVTWPQINKQINSQKTISYVNAYQLN